MAACNWIDFFRSFHVPTWTPFSYRPLYCITQLFFKFCVKASAVSGFGLNCGERDCLVRLRWVFCIDGQSVIRRRTSDSFKNYHCFLVFNLSLICFSVIVQRLPQRGYWPLVKSWQDVRGLWKPSDKVFGRCPGIFTTRQQILWRWLYCQFLHMTQFCPSIAHTLWLFANRYWSPLAQSAEEFR